MADLGIIGPAAGIGADELDELGLFAPMFTEEDMIYQRIQAGNDIMEAIEDVIGDSEKNEFKVAKEYRQWLMETKPPGWNSPRHLGAVNELLRVGKEMSDERVKGMTFAQEGMRMLPDALKHKIAIMAAEPEERETLPREYQQAKAMAAQRAAPALAGEGLTGGAGTTVAMIKEELKRLKIKGITGKTKPQLLAMLPEGHPMKAAKPAKKAKAKPAEPERREVALYAPAPEAIAAAREEERRVAPESSPADDLAAQASVAARRSAPTSLEELPEELGSRVKRMASEMSAAEEAEIRRKPVTFGSIFFPRDMKDIIGRTAYIVAILESIKDEEEMKIIEANKRASFEVNGGTILAVRDSLLDDAITNGLISEEQAEEMMDEAIRIPDDLQLEGLQKLLAKDANGVVKINTNKDGDIVVLVSESSELITRKPIREVVSKVVSNAEDLYNRFESKKDEFLNVAFKRIALEKAKEKPEEGRAERVAARTMPKEDENAFLRPLFSEAAIRNKAALKKTIREAVDSVLKAGSDGVKVFDAAGRVDGEFFGESMGLNKDRESYTYDKNDDNANKLQILKYITFLAIVGDNEDDFNTWGHEEVFEHASDYGTPGYASAGYSDYHVKDVYDALRDGSTLFDAIKDAEPQDYFKAVFYLDEGGKEKLEELKEDALTDIRHDLGIDEDGADDEEHQEEIYERLQEFHEDYYGTFWDSDGISWNIKLVAKNRAEGAGLHGGALNDEQFADLINEMVDVFNQVGDVGAVAAFLDDWLEQNNEQAERPRIVHAFNIRVFGLPPPSYDMPFDEAARGGAFYCGAKKMPGKYDRMGTSNECFRKGIGVGYAASRNVSNAKLQTLSIRQLGQLAMESGVRGYSTMRREQLIDAIREKRNVRGGAASISTTVPIQGDPGYVNGRVGRALLARRAAAMLPSNDADSIRLGSGNVFGRRRARVAPEPTMSAEEAVRQIQAQQAAREPTSLTEIMNAVLINEQRTGVIDAAGRQRVNRIYQRLDPTLPPPFPTRDEIVVTDVGEEELAPRRVSTASSGRPPARSSTSGSIHSLNETTTSSAAAAPAAPARRRSTMASSLGPITEGSLEEF